MTAKTPRALAKAAGPLMIVTGEHSGEILAADLVPALKRKGFSDFKGTGGEAMERAGVELWERVEAMHVVGLLEALKAYRRLKRLLDRLVRLAGEHGVRYAILVDYPGFNLRLAQKLKERGVAVIYLVSPQIWAWKYGRIHKIKKYVDLMLTLFPFEKDIYDREGVPCQFVGHPLISRLPGELRRQEPLVDYPPLKANSRRKETPEKPVIALLPGSRRSEITRHLTVMLSSARELHRQYPSARFLIAGVHTGMRQQIREEMRRFEGLPLEYVHGKSLRVMEASDLLLIASGTATAEAAFLEKPMVMVYRLDWLTYLVFSPLIRTRFVGLVNLLGRRQVVRELLQTEARTENIVFEARKIIDDSDYHNTMIRELKTVRRILGRGSPANRAAKHILDFVCRREADPGMNSETLL